LNSQDCENSQNDDNDDDDDDDDDDDQEVSVSLRGRVRKPTAKARGFH
jgi:hypothetical protein